MSQLRRRNFGQNNVEVVNVLYPNAYSGYFTITKANSRGVLYTQNNSIVVIKDGVILDSSQYTIQNLGLSLSEAGSYEVHYFVKNVSYAYATGIRYSYARVTVPKAEYMNNCTRQIVSISNAGVHVDVIDLLEENPASYNTSGSAFTWNGREENIPDIIHIPVGSKAAYVADERFAPYADRFVEVKYNFIEE